MKFALFFLGRVRRHDHCSAIIVTVFLGGWHLPLPSWHGGFHWVVCRMEQHRVGAVWSAVCLHRDVFAKVGALLFMFMWGALDPAAFPLRPAHAARLALLF